MITDILISAIFLIALYVAWVLAGKKYNTQLHDNGSTMAKRIALTVLYYLFIVLVIDIVSGIMANHEKAKENSRILYAIKKILQ